ncbi:hypothetical protein BC629DRAFT_732128 [Irpex lacteus]|nr:hypothetical protein BC629DRAFT_732128 [Irpex lacteus]
MRTCTTSAIHLRRCARLYHPHFATCRKSCEHNSSAPTARVPAETYHSPRRRLPFRSTLETDKSRMRGPTKSSPTHKTLSSAFDRSGGGLVRMSLVSAHVIVSRVQSSFVRANSPSCDPRRLQQLDNSPSIDTNCTPRLCFPRFISPSQLLSLRGRLCFVIRICFGIISLMSRICQCHADPAFPSCLSCSLLYIFLE